MPLYDYCCPQGHVFEQMATIAARAQQACPACGQAGDKIPSRVTLGGRADPGPSKEQMPQTWRGTYEGNPEYVGQLRRQWSAREKLEEKYPELRGDQRPVLAHEGKYHAKPLRAGDLTLAHLTSPHHTPLRPQMPHLKIISTATMSHRGGWVRDDVTSLRLPFKHDSERAGFPPPCHQECAA